jgi:hypothetical protein
MSEQASFICGTWFRGQVLHTIDMTGKSVGIEVDGNGKTECIFSAE